MHWISRVGILLPRRYVVTSSRKMAKSRFEYVKCFETEERLDPKHWIVIGLRFCDHEKFLDLHNVERPNDTRLVQLWRNSASIVMSEFKEIVFGYGFGGELNLTFAKNTTLYKRRGPKLLTNLSSLMASSFVMLWPNHFQETPLRQLPVLEGSIHLLADDQGLRDLMTQRQSVCHQANLHNTVLWSLVHRCGLDVTQAVETVKNTNEADKNEILFSRCNKNYNKEENVFKKGTILLRRSKQVSVTAPDGTQVQRNQSCIVDIYSDFCKDSFWKEDFILNDSTKNNAKTNYVKDFEQKIKLLPHSWVVVRIDGKGFHKFSEKHDFVKPNDIRSIELMNLAAKRVLEEFPDIVLSYGQSDEYTFVIDRYSRMLDRLSQRVVSRIVSLFAATYVHHWSRVFGDTPLQYSPAFDARAVLYPNNSTLRDYLSWRQADCHINNMYNTAFWLLVQKCNMTRQEAEEKLNGTFSKDKRKILMDIGCDYDLEEAIYRKGSVMYRKSGDDGRVDNSVDVSGGVPGVVVLEHTDIIGHTFWNDHPWILGTERSVLGLPDSDEL